MSEQPRARTAEGVVEGRRRTGYAVFRGIPYARPPVGPLRFRAPSPVEGWEGTRQAGEFGPVAPQAGPTAEVSLGDDWLTLNVATPSVGAAGLPVLVWIHGGAYIAGASGDPMYDPAALTRAGLVVVSVNYRVAVEGFALVEGAPANRGLLDQIAALQWVRRNIAAFGGDPDRVTVAGQSAGAGSIAALLTMEQARGLFHKAIAHSVPGLVSTRDLARDVTAALAARAGATPDVEGMSRITPARLAAELTALGADPADHRERWGRLARIGVAVCPVLDGEVLTATPWQALSDARANGIDLLVGHTRDEFRLFSVMARRSGTYTEDETRTILDLFAPTPHGPDAYRAAHPTATPEELLELVYSDALFRMPSLHLAQANRAAGGTSFLFELRLRAPAGDALLGACHSLDVPLAFGTLDSPTGRYFFGDRPAPRIRAVSRELQQAWVRFATTGDPGWPAHEPDRRLTRLMDVESTTAPYPEATSQRIWEDHHPTPMDLT
ncbi:carboxylesterase/lipase family protein [Embleya sp. MST-111070]|uniref:carboxylesterase/lipase family protein n=1 Tax=Embleya sp. MST-111070 TaxID=3398231 RepID=UPI003F733929